MAEHANNKTSEQTTGSKKMELQNVSRLLEKQPKGTVRFVLDAEGTPIVYADLDSDYKANVHYESLAGIKDQEMLAIIAGICDQFAGIARTIAEKRKQTDDAPTD